MFKEGMLALVGQGFIETIYMTVISTALAYIIGLPLGLVLVVTDKDGIHPIPWLNSLLGMIINFFRSIPFLILLIAAQSMGASPFQIMTKVLLPEAKPSLLVGAAISITTILGYSAMAGIVGAGGLGAIAINYGYYRKQSDIMYVMVILMAIIVLVFQELGMRISKHTDRRL